MRNRKYNSVCWLYQQRADFWKTFSDISTFVDLIVFFETRKIYKIILDTVYINKSLFVEKPSHLHQLTVWYALWSSGVIWPYFCENAIGEIVLVMIFNIINCKLFFLHPNWTILIWRTSSFDKIALDFILQNETINVQY